MDAAQVSVRHFDCQRFEIDPGILQAAGELLVRHQAHTDLGFCLVHRHFEQPPPGYVMLRSASNPNEDITTMESVDIRALHPHSYVTTGGELQPYEWNAEPGPLISFELKQQWIHFVAEQGLEDVLGLTRIVDRQAFWIEELFHSGIGTIARRLGCDLDFCGDNGVITEWAVALDDNGSPRIRAVKACTSTEAGGHKRE